MKPPSGSIRDLLEQRAQEGGTAYHFFEGPMAEMSWADLRDYAQRIARHLSALGIAKGESVAIVMPNGSAAIKALFGVIYGGFRATMINLVAGDDAISYALEHSQARFALVGEGQTALFERCATALNIEKAELEGSQNAPLHSVSADDDALLMYTSGTTGRPKGVVHTHASLLAGGWTPTLAHQLKPDDCGLCVLPVYHINALCVSVMGGLVSGSTIAMAPKFSASRFWSQIAQVKASWFSVVPTIISHLMQGETGPSSADKARLRFGRSASSPLSPDVHAAFEKRFELCLIETMGLTETAAQMLSNPLPPEPRKIGSPGIAIGNETCILSLDGAILPPMEPGEIAVRGPNVMKEYLRNPQATAETLLSNGWLRTGDLGYADEDGYFFVTGRLKELIIKGGENIAPREVDDALYSHPDVVEAAAFSRACATYGEKVEAAVVLRDGSDMGEASLLSLCQERLGTFKSPDRIFLMDELPKGPSGKIQRLKIAELTQS